MANEACRHDWTIVDLQNGYLVTEGCTRCGRRASFFTLKDQPHLDTYMEGGHRWRFLASAQSTRFNLQCAKCGIKVELKNVIGLMLCTECAEDCDVLKLKDESEGGSTWIYVALCSDPMHENGVCVSDEEIRVLEEYFNGNIKSPGKRVRFAPCIRWKSVDVCQGDVIADVGMKEIY
ncbi:MAG: hypothetical protein JW958_00370 [Candidatus Eisenbacteria bacterium]|nr:hypothetical protein [Candidatus Eisenbacteria bacterium]